MAIINLSGSISTTGASILGSYPISFTSDANHTLSPTEYTNKFLEVTSSVSLTTTRSLIAPLVQGQEFVIQNLVSGGQAILVIGSTGTGVTIPSGATVSVVCDGTNYLLPGSSSFYDPINVLSSGYDTYPGITSISSLSNGAVLPQTTINVASATSFASSGNVIISSLVGGNLVLQNISYTGKTTTSFTGCSGGIGTINTGYGVYIPYMIDTTAADYIVVVRTDLVPTAFGQQSALIVLPPIVNGRKLVIKDIGSASSIVTINIFSAPGEYIDSSTTNTHNISAPSASISLVGSTALSPHRWYIV